MRMRKAALRQDRGLAWTPRWRRRYAAVPASRSAPRNEPGCRTRYSAHSASARSTSPRKASIDFCRNNSISAGEIHQIIGVNHQRLQIVLRPQTAHLLAQWNRLKLIGSPLPRAGRENLKRIAAQAIGALGGIVHSSGGGRVNADAAGSQAWRAFWSGTGEDILFAGHGARHEESIKALGSLQAGWVRIPWMNWKKPRLFLAAALVPTR